VKNRAAVRANLLPPYSTAFRGTSPFSATPKKMNPYSPEEFDCLFQVVPTAQTMAKTVQENKSIDRFSNSITCLLVATAN
jgi:hypothetical protein